MDPSSPLQQVATVHIQRFAIPKHRDYQSQAHRRFRRSDHENKENESLAADLTMLAGERNEGKIHCVQHDLDRQQQRDDIPLDEKTQHSDQKQNSADDEIPTDWDHRSFFAKTTAPNRAISISNDVTSKGKKYSVNKLVPIARGLPTSGV